jgi:DNA-binding response OmpR family regulator
VAVTAKHDPEGVLREMVATDHIAKPFLPSELEAVVERALHGSAVDVERERKTLARSADAYGTVSELHRQARREE